MSQDAVDYLTFLAIGAHSLGMAVGLKNAGEIVNQTLLMLQWQVNEQCVEFGECETFQPFIKANKPVFHVEYLAAGPRRARQSLPRISFVVLVMEV